MNQKQSIGTSISKQSEKEQKDYVIRLNATINCIRFLLHQGLSFRGHDESLESLNQGNFLELLKWFATNNEEIGKVLLNNAPKNHKLIAPEIQKQIVSAFASEVSEQIVSDIDDDFYTILVDESRDVSTKEQMAVVLRYVNRSGCIIECFLGLVHVMDTRALSLKNAISTLLCSFGLSFANLRGQGYDGASNMRGEFNGLKTLILNENPSAFYIHCFAHQLQLILVAVAENHVQVAAFFDIVLMVMNCVGSSCKRRDVLRAKEIERVAKELESGHICSGKGQNQEFGVKRASDTRWSSHYGVLVNFIRMFSSIIGVLETLTSECEEAQIKGRATTYLGLIQTFDFVFMLHIMKHILGITCELSDALQRKDQDIVNAMNLLCISRKRLNYLRNDDNQWNSLILKVTSFCEQHDIEPKNMEDKYQEPGRRRRGQVEKTNLHHFRFDILNTVIDRLLNELNDRFSERTTELLLCVACLDPSDNFASFDKERLLNLAQLYPSDFCGSEVYHLDDQLETYIFDVRGNNQFANIKGISALAMKLVQLKMDRVYFLVYRLLKLALLLPVATASVERVFSAMNIIKTRLRNKIGDGFMNDCLVTYIEREVASKIDNDTIMRRFQNMRTRRGTL